MVDMHVAQLLFIASVDETRKLACQAPGCGRAIARAIHVIRDSTGVIRVVGSGCYVTLSGHEQATKQGAVMQGFDGRRLTPDERASMIADTEAFVAGVEAQLAADRKAAQMASESRVCGSRPQLVHDEWKSSVVDGPEVMRTRERMSERDKLAQFRAQQARQAARLAMQRWPELSRHGLEAVADAMARAKAEYLGRGLRMDAPDARIVIESAAIAALNDRASRGHR